MSVNLNKERKQSYKVSLQKEDLKKETKVNQSIEAVSAGEERKKWTLLWIGLPIAAVVMILIAGFTIAGNSTKKDDGISVSAINEEVKVGEDNSNEISQSREENDLQNLAEDPRNIEESKIDNEDSNIDSNEDSNEEASTDAINSNQRVDDASIHNYEVIVADVTWSEAFAECIARGGYLCRINSAEENERIKELLNEQNVRGVVYLGGMRDKDSDEYHWIDANMEPFDEVINDGGYIQFWYDGEPSYVDYVDDKEIIEEYMVLIYRRSTKEWFWNDACDDILSLAPDYYSGKLSYICEYE